MPTSYGFLGTYPPTQCGLATFSHALMRSLATPESGDTAGIVRVTDAPVRSLATEVVGHLLTHSPGSHREAAAFLNTFDVAIIQHQQGIYGGLDGDQLLAVLDQVRMPVVVIAHIVQDSPTVHQAYVLEQIIAASDAVVTLTDAGRDRLIHRYAVDPGKVTVIRHGARSHPAPAGRMPGRRQLILTWGLLGPGKGIEWAIDGLQRLRLLRPAPAYIVAGRTHPRVRLREGESYRLKLAERARAIGVAHLFRFVASYLNEADLNQYIRRADVVLLPFDSSEQITSAVLVEAIAAGKPVVATTFPHAVELLSSGAGLVVPRCDGTALGEALYRVLTEPSLAARMAAEAIRLAPTFFWPTVAAQYRSLVTTLLANRVPTTGSVRAG